MKEWTDIYQKVCGSLLILPYFSNNDEQFSIFLVVFYTLFGLLCIIIVAMIHFGNKLQNVSTDIKDIGFSMKFIKFFFEILNPVLYLPIIQIFFSVYQCSKVDEQNSNVSGEDEDGDSSVSSGKYSNDFFTNQECYTGNYLIHCFAAAIGAIFLFGLSYIGTIINFESRYRAKEVQLKVNGQSDLKLLYFKTIFTLCAAFLDTNLNILLLFIVFLISMALFHEINKSSIFLNYQYCKILNIQSALFFWSALMLVFCQIIYDTDYYGIPYIWLFGIFFISFIIIMRKEFRYDLLLADPNKYESLNQAIQQLLYLTKILNYYQTSKDYSALLDAFLDYHKTICKQTDCPAYPGNISQKQIKRFVKNYKSQNGGNIYVTEQFVILLYLIESIYVSALSRFPACILLRINHALFLLDTMMATQQAMQELEIAVNEKPYLDEQFMIYRYNKLMEEQMVEQRKNQNKSEVAMELNSDSHIKEFMKLIEISASDHSDFWSQLSEDVPDLTKLQDIGLSAYLSSSQLQDYWLKMNKMNIDIGPNIMRQYVRYLLDVLHDKQQAYEISQKLKDSNMQTLERAKLITNINDFTKEPVGLIAISGEDRSLGMIIGVNMTASSLFYFNKNELMNRKINILQPKIISQYHDEALDNYLVKLESTMLNNEVTFMGKQKNGYIFPIILYIRNVPSFQQGIQFFGTIRQDKYFKLIGYMVIDSKNHVIQNVSSNCISLFGLNIQIISRDNIKITDIVPDIFENISDYKKKSGNQVFIDYQFKKKNKVTNTPLYNVTVSDIKMLGKQVAYQVKLEKLSNQTQNQSDQNAIQSKELNNNSYIDQLSVTDRGHKRFLFFNPSFIFYFDCKNSVFNGKYLKHSKQDINSSQNIEYEYDQNMHPITAVINRPLLEYDDNLNLLNKDGVQDINKTSSQSLTDQKYDDKQEVMEQSFDKQLIYGKGIRILRLVGNALQDIDDIKQASFTNEEEEELQEEKENKTYKFNTNLNETKNENDIQDISNTFKSRKLFLKFLSQSQPYYTNITKIFKYMGLLLFICLFFLNLSGYVIRNYKYNQVKTYTDLVQASSDRLFYVQRILYKLTNHYLINLGLYDEYSNMKLDSSYIQETIQELENVQVYLQDYMDKDIIGSKQYQLMTESTVKVQQMEANGQIKEFFVDLNQGTAQIIEKAYSLSSGDYKEISESNTEFYYLKYAILNEYYDQLFESYKEYCNKLYDDSNGPPVYIFLVLSITINLVAIVLFYPIFSYILKNQEEQLKLFLEIPIIKVKQLFSKAEQYLNILQIGEDENQEQSDLDQKFLEEDHGGLGIGRRKKIRKHKFDNRQVKQFIIKLIGILIILETYFVVVFFYTDSITNNIAQQLEENRLTNLAMANYTFFNNALRQGFIDQQFSIQMTDLKNFSDEVMDNLYEIYTDMIQEHAKNLDVNTDDYNNLFSELFNDDVCDQYELFSFNSKSACQNYDQDIFGQGLSSVLTTYFENFRYIISLYNQLLKDASINIGITVKNIYTDTGENKILNIINSNESYQISTLQDDYLRKIYQVLKQKLKESIQNQIDFGSTIRVTLFISFTVVLILAFLFFWIPLMGKIQKDIIQNSNMFGIIPIKIITNTKPLKEYITKQMQST